MCRLATYASLENINLGRRDLCDCSGPSIQSKPSLERPFTTRGDADELPRAHISERLMETLASMLQD